ncbi:hypothetical protein LZ32DRAFT_140267 [Colletotrichum eremochloae]|nr:hypothetical protein LZ32DRAFT_140267 [Colletotrichum eremochloae]
MSISLKGRWERLANGQTLTAVISCLCGETSSPAGRQRDGYMPRRTWADGWRKAWRPEQTRLRTKLPGGISTFPTTSFLERPAQSKPLLRLTISSQLFGAAPDGGFVSSSTTAPRARMANVRVQRITFALVLIGFEAKQRFACSRRNCK